MIPRLVKKEGSDANLYCLLPVTKPHTAFFHVFQLPLNDEVKSQLYPPLPTSPCLPEEVEAVDKLIDSFMGADSGHKSDPSINRRFECVVAKAEERENFLGLRSNEKLNSKMN